MEEKCCEYCDNDVIILDQFHPIKGDNDITMDMWIEDTKFLYHSFGNLRRRIEIKYCPFCGRRLELFKSCDSCAAADKCDGNRCKTNELEHFVPLEDDYEEIED